MTEKKKYYQQNYHLPIETIDKLVRIARKRNEGGLVMSEVSKTRMVKILIEETYEKEVRDK